MEKKVLGILGGMGPAATADLYAKIVALTAASSDGDHIRTIIDSNAQIPDRTVAILFGGESPLEEMESALDNLVCCGAEVIIIPCNTAHYFLPALKEYAAAEFAPADCALNLEFVSMIEETAKACAARNPKRAALLATKGTLESRLYQNALEDLGVNYILPDEDGKDVLMDVIYKGVKAGAEPNTYLPGFKALLDKLAEKGADYFVLACTELPIAFRKLVAHKDDVVHQNADEQLQIKQAGGRAYESVDPTEILAIAAIRACGYTVTKV